MGPFLDHRLLKFKLSSTGECNLLVKGTSMFPVISDGERITVIAEKTYELGDVIVFFRDDDNCLLVHRIVKVEDAFVCKGDNSFRLEHVKKSDVLGRVINISSISNYAVNLSYLVGLSFIDNNYNVSKTKETKVYKEYIDEYLASIQ